MADIDKTFLKINNLEKIYPNGEKAVYDFNLDIKKNEFIVIVGPSGCGKSTTLRMIAGLEDVSSGEIYLEGDLLNYKPSKDRKMAIVFQSYALYPQMNVYDNIAFPLTINKYPFPVVNNELKFNHEVKELLERIEIKRVLDVLYESTKDKYVKENKLEFIANRLDVSLECANELEKRFAKYKSKDITDLYNIKDDIKKDWLKSIEDKYEEEIKKNPHKYNDKFEEIDEEGKPKIEYRRMTDFEIKTKVYETAKTLDLGQYLDKLPKELSGGQMQRVALGRAIVKNVPLFLMDEPLSNLDAKLRLIMRSEIVKIHNSIKATTIYVTHDQTEAMTMATRIVVMSRGFIQQIGTPEEIYDNPKNLFVAKFIGSPSINIINFKYSNGDCLYNDTLKIKAPAKFIKKHEEFYNNSYNEFSELDKNFDKASAEKILKIKSALGGEKKHKAVEKKKNVFKKIESLFSKKVETDDSLYEKIICDEMLDKLGKARKEEHDLVMAIRPENMKLDFYDETKPLKENQIVLTSIVTELLGAEYHVHFEYKGIDLVCKFDKKKKIYPGDKFVLTIDFSSAMIFDTITGGRIY